MAHTGAKPVAVFDRNHPAGKPPLAYVSQQATGVGASKAAGNRPVKWSLRFPNGDPCPRGCWIVWDRNAH